MSQDFVDLALLIPGERYSFTTTLFPGRVEGTFDRLSARTGQDNQYIFSNVIVNMNDHLRNVTFGVPSGYPQNITHILPAGAPPLTHQQPPAGAPPDARGKSRKTKRTRKSKRRHIKSKRRHIKSKRSKKSKHR